MIRKAIIVMLSLAAVGTLGLWGYCDWSRDWDAIRHGAPMRAWEIIDRTLGERTFTLDVELDTTDVHFGLSRRRYTYSSPPRAGYTDGYFAGFHYAHSVRFRSPVGSRISWWAITMIGVPFWALTVIFAAYPTIAYIRGPLRSRRRRRKGLCLKCGYDLTGNESGVCPECGHHLQRGRTEPIE